MRFSAFRRTVLPAFLLPVLGACNEEPDNPFDDWTATEDTVTLYTADRVEYQGLPSAYDIVSQRTLRIEDPTASGAWDFALTGGDGGPLTLTPMGAFFDVESLAGLSIEADLAFEEIERAPTSENAYETEEAVALEEGVVYIVRSRQTSGNCFRFGKLEPLEIDQDAGTLTFRLTRNPNCNGTELVPPED